MRVAVVGHIEWVQFLRVPATPATGEIVHAVEWWEHVGGGGAAAAREFARLADEVYFYTVVGDDNLGTRAIEELESLGIRVAATVRGHPTRRAITHVDSQGERTITVVGERAGPFGSDPLPWKKLGDMDCVFLTAGDPRAYKRAREARVVTATSRALDGLRISKIALDALIGSASDPSESYGPGSLDPAPGLVVMTEGEAGGTYIRGEGPPGRYEAATPPSPIDNRYGAGDVFAAALTFALARGDEDAAALAFAAERAALAITRREP